MTDDERGGRARLGAELGARDAREAHDFEAVAAQLGMTLPSVEPRPEVKAAIFAQLDGLPQLPPVTAGALPETASPSRPAGERARLRWFQRPGAVLSAAAAAVLIFTGGSFFGNVLAGAAPDRQQASALVEINAAPDVRFQSSEVVGGGTVTLVWSVQLRQAALVTKGLPKLADDKVYELWYLRKGTAIPAGTMTDVDGDSTVWRVLTGEMAAGDAVGVTVEPQGGSNQPTTPPIVGIAS